MFFFSGISLSELEGIASYPTDQTVMTVNSFDDVRGLANKLAEGLCDSKSSHYLFNL